MARKYTDSGFVIQTTANISDQRGKASTVDQVPFSLIPFTAKSIQQRDRAYIISKRPNPYDFLFEVEKMEYAFRESSVNTSATVADRIIFIDTGGKTVTLPTAGSVRAGFVLTIKDGGNAGTSALTVTRSGSDTIDGGTSISLTSDYASVDLISNGSNAWYVI